MANTFRRFLKGIVLKPETAAPTEQVEGSLYQNGTDERLGTFIEGLDREILTDSQAQEITNKSIDADDNTITNIGDSELTSGINANKIADGSVSNTEFQFINSLTSNAQTQIDSKASQAALDAHINDVSDAHDASAISYDNTSSGLSATQVQAAIDELAASSPAGAILADGTVPMAADLDLDGNKIINLADPTNPQDAATKTYVDGIVGGTLTVQQNGTPVVTGTTILNFISGATIVDGGAGEAEITITGGSSISGTADVIAKFNATGDNVEDSNMSDDGTNIILEVPPVMRDAQILFTNNAVDTLFIHTDDGNSPSFSTFMGYGAGTSITTGTANTGIGAEALENNLVGQGNVAIGVRAMQNNTGSFSTALGFEALLNGDTNTQQSVAIGYLAMSSLTTGGQNTAVGTTSAVSLTSGEQNLAVGNSAMGANTQGHGNTIIGYNAMSGYNGSSGINGYNVALGHSAGASATGDSYHNIFIGSNAGPVSSGAVTQKLYINPSNSPSDTPLIYGDISTAFVRFHNSLQLPEVAAPGGAPPADYTGIYYSTDGVLFLQDEVGEQAALGGKNHTQTILNNQASPVAVTDMVYSSATYRSVKISYSINRTTTLINITQTGYIILRVDSAGWNITDNSDQGSIIGVTFTVDTGTGQVSYTSTNASGTGHVGTLKWCVKDKFIL